MSLKEVIRSYTYKNSLLEKIWAILHSVNLQYQKRFDDVEYFSRAYKRVHGNLPDFTNPLTFDEKQLWIKCFYRNPLYVTCSDKYLVQEYVRKKGLGHILNPILAVYDNPKDIEWDRLPNRFYMKANHASGLNMRCNDLNTFDKQKAVKYFEKALKKNYYYESREWNYRDIQPKVIIENILEDKNGKGLVDYRFLCFGGKCEYIFIDIGTAGDTGEHLHDARRNVYDRNMNLLDVKVTRERFNPSLVSKPEKFEIMRSYAEILSTGFPFCRVDLYNIDERIVFGEITFFHAGGLSKITPDVWNYKLGMHIDIDKLKLGEK